MAPVQFLARAARLGFTVVPRGGEGIALTPPPGKQIPHSLRTYVKQHKAEILALLAWETPNGSITSPRLPDTRGRDAVRPADFGNLDFGGRSPFLPEFPVPIYVLPTSERVQVTENFKAPVDAPALCKPFVANDLLRLAAEADLEHELLLAHYGQLLPVAVKPLIKCPSGRHIGNLAVAVSGMLQRHRGEGEATKLRQQEGVHITPQLALADAVDWEFLLSWWRENTRTLGSG